MTPFRGKVGLLSGTESVVELVVEIDDLDSEYWTGEQIDPAGPRPVDSWKPGPLIVRILAEGDRYGQQARAVASLMDAALLGLAGSEAFRS
jgi:hypothetical protein